MEDPWALELVFGRGQRLQTDFGPVEFEYVDGGHQDWLHLRSEALVVSGQRYSLSALLTRDEDGHLNFATFAVSSRFGGTLPRARFSETEAQLFEIAREWALAHTPL